MQPPSLIDAARPAAASHRPTADRRKEEQPAVTIARCASCGFYYARYRGQWFCQQCRRHRA